MVGHAGHGGHVGGGGGVGRGAGGLTNSAKIHNKSLIIVLLDVLQSLQQILKQTHF